MGNAGIIRELLRYARIQEGPDPGYAIAWPDHPPARPPFPAVIPHRLLPRVSPGDDPGGPDKYQTAGGNSVRAVTLVEVHGDVQKGRPQ
jgi:hypothetical protein